MPDFFLCFFSLKKLSLFTYIVWCFLTPWNYINRRTKWALMALFSHLSAYCFSPPWIEGGFVMGRSGRWRGISFSFFIFSRLVPHPSIHAYHGTGYGGRRRGYHLSTCRASVPTISLHFPTIGFAMRFYSTVRIYWLFFL